MEIRIVSFTEEKAKQFIYQKDQKTKMKQIDSAAMNQYSPANTVVTQLNTNPGSNIRGAITKTGNIDPAFLDAVTETLVPDGQNHFLEVDNDAMIGCLNTSLLEKTIITREELEERADTLINYTDRFVFYALFEGLY